jgi:DNA polymerase (family 10)
MKNAEVASLLEEMRALLELSNANPFKIRAYGRASQALGELTRDVEQMSRDELLEIEGIGEGIADKIQEYLKTSEVKELNALRAKFPAGVLEIMRLPGLGPKRALLLYQKMKVDSPAKLKALAEGGKLHDLAGFGEKMEQNILQGIEFAQEASQRIIHGEARATVEEVLSFMRGTPGLIKSEVAGSYRRLKETSGDLDFLCSSKSPGDAISRFTKMPRVERILAAGGTKASVILKGGPQCDLRVVKPESWGSALLYFTGSKEHNVRLRELALKKGLTINEYGLFRLKDGKKGRPLAGRTEEELYKALGLDFIPPELREDRGEIQAAGRGRLPRLVELKDVRGDFHNHTELTDGIHTHEAMAEAAKKRGWEWVFIGDHSQSLTVAHGLTPAKLRKKIETIRRLNQKSGGLEILCGMEVDILADGRLDYDDETLSEIDCVVASVHSRFSQSEDVMTSRIRKAVENPRVDILGHLTGRLIGKRKPYAVNVQEILEAARATQTAVEINGQPERQELSDVHAKTARDMGVPLAVTTDAHSTQQFDNMETALCVARRAWIEPKNLLNCMNLKELKEWLGR